MSSTPDSSAARDYAGSARDAAKAAAPDELAARWAGRHGRGGPVRAERCSSSALQSVWYGSGGEQVALVPELETGCLHTPWKPGDQTHAWPRPNRIQREEQSAKGPLEALADAVKGAAEFVK